MNKRLMGMVVLGVSWICSFGFGANERLRITAEQPDFSDAVVEGSNLSISEEYLLQRSDDLMSGHWQNVWSPVSSVTNAHWRVAPDRAMSFYRLVPNMVPAKNHPWSAETINDDWFYLASDTETLPTLGDAAYSPITLPHTWNANDTLVVGNYRRASSWYRKNLEVTPEMLDQRVYLRFGAAGQRAKVFVNGLGQSVLYHNGGYSAFVCELTGRLSEGSNRIDVWVDNTRVPGIIPQSGDFNFYGGLYRSVQLIVAPEISISRNYRGGPGVRVWSEAVSEDSSDLQVRVRLDNGSTVSAALTVAARLLDSAGRVVSSGTNAVTIAGNAGQSVDVDMPDVEQPGLWSPEHPELYTLVVTLLQDGLILDSSSVKHGFRWFEFTARKGFFLNGRSYKLHGANRHQDKRGVGNALDLQQHYEDLMHMKEAGCNWVRLAHYQQDDYVLQLCDELGLLVWEEIPYVNEGDVASIQPAMESMMREMIEQHFNHPSVVVWGIGNEVMSLQTPTEDYDAITGLVSDMDALVHAEDPIRKSAFVSGDLNLSSRQGIVTLVDVFGYNLYRGWYANEYTSLTTRLNELHAMKPDTPLVLTEFGAGSDLTIHSDLPVMQDFSIEYQNDFLESHLQQLKAPALNWLCGSTWWAFYDFGSSYRGDSIPRVNQKGVMTFDRRETKDAFYLMKSYWSDEPVVHIESETWSNRAGLAEKSVRIFSNMDMVELFLNGVSQGVQSSGFIWPVELVAGDNALEAIGTTGLIEKRHAVTVEYTPTYLASATAEESGNLAGNAVDGDPSTRWAAQGDQSLTIDLLETRSVSGLEISFYNGSSRNYYLEILGSSDGSNWTSLFDGASSGVNIETFSFGVPRSLRYIRIDGAGSSVSDWNSYYETTPLLAP
ncbi:MAG: discoidin domain-containing protein [Pontiellaceae bacterium]|nr:discoidin domain-containing protein [Pontiellaceae bacterium]MBN2783481.1 discoidin domain-containing protein [Pontiellaceae bacterium]